MHNGAALYAKDAGKLNGLAPEAYIQPQDNILDNWYFKINQNNKTEYLTFGISVDRWTVNRAIVKVYADCISLRWNGTDRDNGDIFEKIERDALLPNAIYTFSVLVKDVGLLSITFTTKTEAPSEPIFIAQKRFGDLELSVHDTPKYYQFNIYTYSTKESYLKAAKAEPGAYFTGWPAWNYALELAKCQRYYFNTINKENYAIVSSAAYARTNNRLQCVINSPVSMRTRPVPKIIGKIFVRRYNATHIKEISADIASIDCYSSLPWALSLDITLTDGTTPFVAGEYYNLIIETMSGNYLEFNANL